MANCLKEGWIVKFAQRYYILKQATEGFISCKEGAEALKISERHFKRLKKKFQKLGQKALIHGNRGRTPPNPYPQEIKQEVLRLFRSQYHNFNVSHFTDILKEEHGIKLSRQTIRSWLIKAGLLEPKSPKQKRRKRRPRSQKEGQLVFLDGSLHVWLAEKQYTLLWPWMRLLGRPLVVFLPPENPS